MIKQQPIIKATHARAVAAAENYTAGDIVSNSATNGAGTPWTFNADIKGTILGGVITCNEDSVVWRLRLHLFSESPSSATEMDDNVAKAFDNDDRTKYIGYIDFPAMSDMGEFSMTQVQTAKPYWTANRTLYGVLETLDGESNETAGMTMEVTLWLLPLT